MPIQHEAVRAQPQLGCSFAMMVGSFVCFAEHAMEDDGAHVLIDRVPEVQWIS